MAFLVNESISNLAMASISLLTARFWACPTSAAHTLTLALPLLRSDGDRPGLPEKGSETVTWWYIAVQLRKAQGVPLFLRLARPDLRGYEHVESELG